MPTPVNTPVVLMVPMAGLMLAHVPGAGADVSVALLPTQTEEELAVMTDGSAFTVIALTLKQPLEPRE